jgi:hypothetical protein
VEKGREQGREAGEKAERRRGTGEKEERSRGTGEKEERSRETGREGGGGARGLNIYLTRLDPIIWFKFLHINSSRCCTSDTEHTIITILFRQTTQRLLYNVILFRNQIIGE